MITLALMTIGSGAMWVIPVVLPAVQADFGVARADASLPYTAMMIGFGVGGIWMGRLADRHGVMWPTLLGSAGIVAGVVTNVCEFTERWKVNRQCVDLLGTIGLSLFLAMSLMSLRLWELTNLAGPMLLMMLAQTAGLALYAYHVTFRVMGSDYDAAVIAGGHCGFGMGATPNLH